MGAGVGLPASSSSFAGERKRALLQSGGAYPGASAPPPPSATATATGANPSNPRSAAGAHPTTSRKALGRSPLARVIGSLRPPDPWSKIRDGASSLVIPGDLPAGPNEPRRRRQSSAPSGAVPVGLDPHRVPRQGLQAEGGRLRTVEAQRTRLCSCLAAGLQLSDGALKPSFYPAPAILSAHVGAHRDPPRRT